MDRFLIEGGAKLHGDVQVMGAKNAALPILFATLLARGRCRIGGVPRLSDAEQPAKVEGTDSETDLALLRIDPKGAALAPIRFANSDQVRVGHLCLAVGSPFGYSHSEDNSSIMNPEADFFGLTTQKQGACQRSERPIDAGIAAELVSTYSGKSKG